MRHQFSRCRSTLNQPISHGIRERTGQHQGLSPLNRSTLTFRVSNFPAWKTLAAHAFATVKYGLHHSWNYFGRDDELGTINFLTPEVVAEGAKEIKDGVIISMNLPIQVPSHPSFGRPAAAHTVVTKNPKRPVNDDVCPFSAPSRVFYLS